MVSYRCSLQWILPKLLDRTSLKRAAEVKSAVLHVSMLCTLGPAEALIHPTALQQSKMFASVPLYVLQLGVVPSRGFLGVSCVAHGNSNAAGKSQTVNPDFAWNWHCGAFLTLQLGTFS